MHAQALRPETDLDLQSTPCDADLFSRVGVFLPIVPPPAAAERGQFVTLSYAVPGTPFVVHRSAAGVAERRWRPEFNDSQQLTLNLSRGSRQVSRFIPSSCSAFMNARIRSVFNGTALTRNAALHMMEHGLLYLGDLTKLTQYDLLPRLGRYASMLPEIERKLFEVGLSLDSLAPWWCRPRDYYHQSR